MFTTRAFAASSPTSPLAAASIPRRDAGPDDVELEILFCGVCHSDLHTARNEWAVWPTIYPCVPGHEIVGRVTKTGANVTSFKPGELAAVGCMVASCRTCASCRDGLEQYCDTNGTVFTYNSPDPDAIAPATYGGYSGRIVVNAHFVLRVSPKLDPAAAAPLLCAGITLYSPLRHWGAGPGKKVGIVGLGGLGHMGVKFAHAFGAHTVLFTTSTSKIQDGKRLGADEVVVSKNADEMSKHHRSFDLIVNTVAASHNLDPFLSLLKRDGAMVLVGAPEHPRKGVTPNWPCSIQYIADQVPRDIFRGVLSDHVLIVDDEAPIRQVLARWINAIGYETAEAESAEMALEAMTANPAAVVFCDVQMPGQGGLWLAGVLRAQFPAAAIVLATGVTSLPATTSLRAGILAYLTKPFHERGVRDALERSMAWHDAAVASGPQPSQPEDEGTQLQAWLDSLE